MYVIRVWLTCQTPAAGGLIVCECMSVCMSVCPKTCRYIARHDEWLIMKLCMNDGYHDANNVSNFCCDPVNQLNLKNALKLIGCFTGMALHIRDAVTVFAAVATRSRADCSSIEDRRCKSIIFSFVQYNCTIKWPYQLKHSPSYIKPLHLH